MPLPLVDFFIHPYENWSFRQATDAEAKENYEKSGSYLTATKIQDKLLDRVASPLEAAKYIAKAQVDNALGSFINNSLNQNQCFQSWVKTMPSRTPPEIAKYQKKMSKCDLNAVNVEINQHGSTLSDDQYLFHAGAWSDVNKFVTTKPLSTTFCPQVALRNAEFNAKAYDAGKIDLVVLRANKAKTKVFSFKRKGTKLGHENEVLFATGATLVRQSKTLVRCDYPVGKREHPEKTVPFYVLEFDIS